MDSLTQATLGAAVGELVLGRRLGNRAIAWGALFGTLPDLDVLVAPLFDTAGNLWWHRGPSHSLLVMVAASLLLARPMSRLWQGDKVGSALAGWFIFMVWSTHVLIDCFTVYGTHLLWPFSATRVAFNHLFIIDPLFTLPMLVCLAWLAFLRKPKQWPKRRRLNRWGLGLACGYVLLSLGAKAWVSHGFDRDLDARQAAHLRRIEAPTAFNILLWRSVVERDDSFWVGYRSVLEPPSRRVHWTVYPKGREAVDDINAPRELGIIDHFSDGWWIARRHNMGVWIGDLRFGEMRNWGSRDGMVDHRLSFAWDLLPDKTHDRLQAKYRQAGDAGEMMRQLARRMLGGTPAWRAAPRLEGVTGSLPEFLHTHP